MRTQASCGLRHDYSYNLGLKPALVTPTVNRGSLFHVGAAAYLWTGYPGPAYAAIKEKYEADVKALDAQGLGLLESDYERFKLDYVVADAMLRGWIENYGTPRPIARVMGVEVQFSFEFFGVIVAGRTDAVAIDENGRPVLIEWKTSTQTGESFKNMLMLDWQTIFYAWALEEYVKSQWYETGDPRLTVLKRIGERILPDGKVEKIIPPDFSINNAHIFIAKQPSIRVRQKETLEQYQERVILDYQERKDFYFTQEWLPIDERLKGRMASWARSMIADIASDRPATPSWDMRVCERCWYKRLCTGEAEIGVDFVKRGAHEELGKVTL